MTTVAPLITGLLIAVIGNAFGLDFVEALVIGLIGFAGGSITGVSYKPGGHP